MTRTTETPLQILVVEDDSDIRMATARVLRKAGHRVEEAEAGAQALERVRQDRPDLVLLDVDMPDMDGYAVCRAIKTDPALKGIYVMMVSGTRTDSDDQSQGLETGADGYVTRPIANRELLARIMAMERIIRAERERDRLIGELQAALAQVRTLSGLLPICSYCKQIRDDRGYWNRIERYVSERSDAQFSHSICPECMRKHFPEIDLEE